MKNSYNVVLMLKASPATIDRLLHLAAIDAVEKNKPLDQLWKIADASQLAFRKCIGNEQQQESLIGTICLLDGAMSKQSATRPSIPTRSEDPLSAAEQRELEQLLEQCVE